MRAQGTLHFANFMHVRPPRNRIFVAKHMCHAETQRERIFIELSWPKMRDPQSIGQFRLRTFLFGIVTDIHTHTHKICTNPFAIAKRDMSGNKINLIIKPTNSETGILYCTLTKVRDDGCAGLYT